MNREFLIHLLTALLDEPSRTKDFVVSGYFLGHGENNDFFSRADLEATIVILEEELAEERAAHGQFGVGA